MTSNVPLPPSPSQAPGATLKLDDVLSRSFRTPAAGERGVSNSEVAGAVLQVPPGRWADRVELLLEGYTLSARQRGALVVSERVLRAWCRQPAFHPRLGEALLRCSGGLIACALDQKSWLAHRRHPVHEVLDVITDVAQAWYPGHPHARVLRARLCAWLDRIRTPADAVRIRSVALAWYRRYQQDMSAGWSTEPGPLGEEYARRKSASVIDRQLAGRQQPLFMVQDLHEHWWPALVRVLTREGEASRLFNRAVRTLSLIIWALHPAAASPRHHGKLQRVAEQLRHELPELLSQLIDDSAVSRRLLEHIEVNIYSVLGYRQIRRQAVPPLSAEPLPPAVEVSADLLDSLERISERDWFELKPRGIRARVFRQGEQEAVLVSQAREKVLVCTRRELAWRLATGELAPVPVPVSSSELIIERLRILAQELKGRVNADQRKPARRSSSRVEAIRPARRGARHAAEPQGDGSAESYKLARLAVSGMGIGARLRFLDEDQSWRVIMKLPSSDLFLLVDNQGLDRREIFGQDLTEALAEGEALVLHQGEDSDYFDRVVRSIEGERRHKTAAP